MTRLQDTADWLAVTLWGGVRVRLSEDGTSTVRGRTAGPPPERILGIVRELAEDRAGTVDVRHDGRGHWRVRGGGELADPRFEQRLRNVLGNS